MGSLCPSPVASPRSRASLGHREKLSLKRDGAGPGYLPTSALNCLYLLEIGWGWSWAGCVSQFLVCWISVTPAVTCLCSVHLPHQTRSLGLCYQVALWKGRREGSSSRPCPCLASHISSLWLWGCRATLQKLNQGHILIESFSHACNY